MHSEAMRKGCNGRRPPPAPPGDTGALTYRVSATRPKVIREVLLDHLSQLPRAIGHADAADAAAFQQGYLEASGYCVDLDFLTRSQMIVLRDSSRQIIGGYVINDHEPLRTLARLPTGAAAALPIDRRRSMVEVTCVWLHPNYRGVGSTVLWTHLALRVGKRQNSTIVFGTEVKKLGEFYESFGARQVYSGIVTVDGKRENGWIYTIDAARWPHLIASAIGRRKGRASDGYDS